MRESTTQQTRRDVLAPHLARRIGGLAGASMLAIFGVAAILHGLDGRATVRDALRSESIVGPPRMTPAAMGAKAKQAGLRGVDMPNCSVAGKTIADGASARCFAQYMRIDVLMASGGKTYAQIPAFATADGQGTDDPARAQTGPGGRPIDNPALTPWITETALSTALNTSYMAEQISRFGIAVGSALLLIAMAFTLVALVGVRSPLASPAFARRRHISAHAHVA